MACSGRVVTGIGTSLSNSRPASAESPSSAPPFSSAFSCSAAAMMARPPSTLPREAVVWPPFSSWDVFTTIRTWSGRRPSSVHATCCSTVCTPCPISVHWWNTVTPPSSSTRITARPVSGSPLPIPVFFTAHARPTAFPAARASSQTGFTASSVAFTPTPGPSTCPVPNRSPTSTAFRHRISHPSRPAISASRSRHPSMAKLAWFEPNPRIAPHGGLFV